MNHPPAEVSVPPLDLPELDPELAAFVRRTMPSFQAWELLHLLAENPGLTGTLEDFALRLARRPDDPALVEAAARLAEQGILKRSATAGGRVIYRLAPGPHCELLRRIAEHCHRDPSFHLRLMYHIMMAD